MAVATVLTTKKKGMPCAREEPAQINQKVDEGVADRTIIVLGERYSIKTKTKRGTT